MADFNQAYANTMNSEGGYSNLSADRGGETYMGISRKNFPEWDGWAIIDSYKGNVNAKPFSDMLSDNLELQKMVRAFYKENFWPAQLDQLDQDVANEIFDTGVNQGLKTAIKYFQQALNALNRNQKDYPNINADGAFGALTIAAYQSFVATQKYQSRSYEAVIKVLLKMMNYYQMERYLSIIARDESQEGFLFGWMERVRS